MATGGKVKFAPPPLKKSLKNDTEMSSFQLIMCIFYIGVAYMYILRLLT